VSDTTTWILSAAGLYRVRGQELKKILLDSTQPNLGARALAVQGDIVAVVDDQNRLALSKDGGESFKHAALPDEFRSIDSLTVAHQTAYVTRPQPERWELLSLGEDGALDTVDDQFAGYPIATARGELELLANRGAATKLVTLPEKGAPKDGIEPPADVEVAAHVGDDYYGVQTQEEGSYEAGTYHVKTRVVRLKGNRNDSTVADYSDLSYVSSSFSAGLNGFVYSAERPNGEVVFYEASANGSVPPREVSVQSGAAVVRIAPNGRLVAAGKNGQVVTRPSGATVWTPVVKAGR
jgi:hypothetical protein